mmetsp:Transcript_90543/g.264974  ORF Transcript_90543/g.264974 Transcript_90543/m.264974 type:complete len:208 (-) Transcript_90543:1122-1745(-)
MLLALCSAVSPEAVQGCEGEVGDAWGEGIDQHVHADCPTHDGVPASRGVAEVSPEEQLAERDDVGEGPQLVRAKVVHKRHDNDRVDRLGDGHLNHHGAAEGRHGRWPLELSHDDEDRLHHDIYDDNRKRGKAHDGDARGTLFQPACAGAGQGGVLDDACVAFRGAETVKCSSTLRNCVVKRPRRCIPRQALVGLKGRVVGVAAGVAR